MYRLWAILTGIVVLASGSAVPTVWANVVLGSNTWDTTTEDWDADEDYVDVYHDAADGGFLGVTITNSVGPGEVDTTVYTSATNLFAGAWTNSMWVEFDFWAETVAPFDLEVWFRGTGGDIWSYNLTPSGVGSWTDYSVSLGFSGWVYGEGTSNPGEGVFLSDLAAIDWIGVYIYDGSEGNHTFGLDNWQLMVPEPAEYVLALSALAVIGLSLRKRRKSASGATG